jgi:hypothetical protein
VCVFYSDSCQEYYTRLELEQAKSIGAEEKYGQVKYFPGRIPNEQAVGRWEEWLSNSYDAGSKRIKRPCGAPLTLGTCNQATCRGLLQYLASDTVIFGDSAG